jgi:hypothetical protein
MSDEPDKAKKSTWLAFWVVMGALFTFAVLARVFNSPSADAPKNSGGEALPFPRLSFGADKAVAIAIEEVKKREGWSSNPDWVTSVEADEALTWDVTVKRAPRSPRGARLVVVSAQTGKVLNYFDPSVPR